MSELLVNTIKKADGTGSLSVPAESGTVVTTASPSLGRRNLIINGGFNVWQRGTSGSGGGYKSADRWFNNFYSAGVCITSRRTDATGQDFTEYARVEQSSAGTVNGMQALYQIIEGTYAVGKTITVSFTARASKTLTTCRVRECFSSPQTFTLTTDWQRFTFTGTCIASGSNTTLNIDLGLNNDTWYVDLAEVQLEIGSVATPFEHRSYGEELALCQRYYYLLKGTDTAATGLIGFYYNSSFMQTGVVFPTEMRATPTLDYDSGTDYWRFYRDNSNDTFNTFAFNGVGKRQAQLVNTSEVSGTSGQAGFIESVGLSRKLAFDAEL